MAYQQNFNDDDEQNQGAAQTGSETVLSPESSSANSNPATGAAPTEASKPRGSGYTNLSQYVDANKDQAAGMAGKVTGEIAGRLSSAQDQAKQFQSTVGSKAKENTVQDTGVIGALQNGPTKFGQANWQAQYKKNVAGYQGPQSAQAVEGYQPLADQFQKVDQSAKALDSQAGRYQAAQDTFSKTDKQYNRGENLLDSFLLGTGAGSKVLGDYKQSYQAAAPTTSWENLVSGLNTQIGQARDTSNATKTATESALKGRIGAFDQDFDAKQSSLDKQNAQNAAGFQGLQAQLGSQDAAQRAQGFQQLGIDPAEGEWLVSQGYNPLQLAQQTGARGLGDVVGAQDQQGYEALLGLQGQTPSRAFTTTGNKDAAYNVNQQQLGAIRPAKAIEDAVKGRLSEQQAKRNSDYDLVQNAISSPTQKAAEALGLDDYQLQEAIRYGLLNPEGIKKGADLNYGDVATNDERSQFSNLMNTLGLSGIDLQDTQDEGSAYKFDRDSLLGGLNASRLAEEKAAIAQRDANLKALTALVTPTGPAKNVNIGITKPLPYTQGSGGAVPNAPTGPLGDLTTQPAKANATLADIVSKDGQRNALQSAGGQISKNLKKLIGRR
jgi:hypothetical protein